MKLFVSILVYIFCSQNMGAQSFENEIIYNNGFLNGVKRTLEDNQQNVIIAGYSRDTSYHYSGFLLKVSLGFDTTSTIIENDTADILFTDMLITPENNYFVIGGIGRDTGYYHQGNHIAIYIFNEDLVLLAEKSYPLPEGYRYPQLYLWQAENGDVYAAGREGSPSTNMLLLKFDGNGEMLMENYPNLSGLMINSVLPMTDNQSGFYVFGDDIANGEPGMDRMEVDTNLNHSIESFDSDLFTNGFLFNSSAKWLNDSVFLFSTLVATDTIGTPWPLEDNVLIKVSKDLEVSNEYITVGFPQTRDYGFSYNLDWKTTDKMYVATFDAYPTPGQWRYLIALFNENLEILGTKTISGGEVVDYALWRICATTDGGIVCTGQSRTYGSQTGELDVFVHKLLPGDIVQVAEKTANPYDSDYFVYPNPGQDQIYILTARKDVKVELYNENGQLLLDEMLIDTFKSTVNTSLLPQGIYILRLMDREGYHENIKWIKKK